MRNPRTKEELKTAILDGMRRMGRGMSIEMLPLIGYAKALNELEDAEDETRAAEEDKATPATKKVKTSKQSKAPAEDDISDDDF